MNRIKVIKLNFVASMLSLFALGACSYNTAETEAYRYTVDPELQASAAGMPKPDISLFGLEKLDHKIFIPSKYCSAHNYIHNFREPFLTLLNQLDLNGSTEIEADRAAPNKRKNSLLVKVMDVQTSLRCVEVSTYSVKCIGTMNLNIAFSRENQEQQEYNLSVKTDRVDAGLGCGSYNNAAIAAGKKMLNATHMKIKSVIPTSDASTVGR